MAAAGGGEGAYGGGGDGVGGKSEGIMYHCNASTFGLTRYAGALVISVSLDVLYQLSATKS